MLDKQVLIRIDSALEKRIAAVLDTKKPSQYGNKSAILRKAIELGLNALEQQE